MHSCMEVREPIELSFEVVNGVGQGIDVLDGSQHDGVTDKLFRVVALLHPNRRGTLIF